MEAQPIGTIHIKHRTVRKQIRRQRFIKVSHHGAYRNRWRPLARYWWEQHVGPIPTGFQVFHLDGDALNDAPENLILTREQRFSHIFANQSEAAQVRQRRQACAVIKSNRLRAQVRASQMRPTAWYVVLPASRVIIWKPCKTRGRARRIQPDELVEMCRQVRRRIKTMGGQPFVAGDLIEVLQGVEILRLSGLDGRLEGFWRVVPETRRKVKHRQSVNLEIANRDL